MRILVIEDEQSIADLLQKALEAECFAVDIASDGEKGAYLAKINEYDAIVLDYKLPKKDGKEVVKELRDKGKTVPIIVLTVRGETADKIDLLNAGADDYLTKPFSLEELLARIRAIIRRPQAIKGDVLRLDDLELDGKAHTVRRGDKNIYLTRKEFMLLEYLMRYQGAVLSRGMIMEHVWDMNADPFSNTIESHITSLRKKVDFKNKKLIHTFPGRGYKIEAPT